MGNVAVTGIIGNVGKDLFDADTAIAAVALAGARAKALDVTIENKGLFERYLDKAAKEQKTKPESLRRAYAAGAAFVVPAMIGSSEQARTLSQAIARFIAKPDKLTINATPKDPSGFGIVEAVFLPDPKASPRQAERQREGGVALSFTRFQLSCQAGLIPTLRDERPASHSIGVSVVSR